MPSIPRRRFLQAGAAALAAPSLAPAAAPPARLGPPFTLGLVTYNLAARWDLPTLLRVCRSAGV